MACDVQINDLLLLVNDIPDHVVLYDRALRMHGFRVQVASTGEEALEYARQTAPDCAVIDVRLPDMSGWELCRAIKQDPAAGQMPVVILTPDVTRVCADDSRKSGCNAWLTQPTVAADLVRAVRQVLALEMDEPESPEAAVIGLRPCPACESERVKATLRMSLIQYYCCGQCGYCWRVDAPPVAHPG